MHIYLSCKICCYSLDKRKKDMNKNGNSTQSREFNEREIMGEFAK